MGGECSAICCAGESPSLLRKIPHLLWALEALNILAERAEEQPPGRYGCIYKRGLASYMPSGLRHKLEFPE